MIHAVSEGKVNILEDWLKNGGDIHALEEFCCDSLLEFIPFYQDGYADMIAFLLKRGNNCSHH